MIIDQWLLVISEMETKSGNNSNYYGKCYQIGTVDVREYRYVVHLN